MRGRLGIGFIPTNGRQDGAETLLGYVEHVPEVGSGELRPEVQGDIASEGKITDQPQHPKVHAVSGILDLEGREVTNLREDERSPICRDEIVTRKCADFSFMKVDDLDQACP
jgi:hypothetical protein